MYRIEGLPNRRLAIDVAGNTSLTRNANVTWLNFGDEVRAGNYLTQKLNGRLGELPGTTVRSFEVPKSYFDSLNSRLIPESQRSLFPNNPIQSLDGPGQIGIPRGLYDELESNIVPGSGINWGGF